MINRAYSYELQSFGQTMIWYEMIPKRTDYGGKIFILIFFDFESIGRVPVL